MKGNMVTSIGALLNDPIIAINVGVQDFGEVLEQQQVRVIYVDWSPPAGGDQPMIDLLDELL
jgi:FdrA protein